ncbi:MAG: hypothetical protein OXU74_14500 [Gemmatimonadota bacterium]|nr:hypothetical protein [Gemmatimonadota bacterium]
MMRFEETWLAENLRKRDEELRREGHEKGHQEGHRRGHREGRQSLLRQLALQEFGPGGVAQLAEVLDERAGSDRDGALARAIIECDTVAQVIARARGL